MPECNNSRHGSHEWVRNYLGGLVQDICAYCGAVKYPFDGEVVTHSSSYTVVKEFKPERNNSLGKRCGQR